MIGFSIHEQRRATLEAAATTVGSSPSLVSSVGAPPFLCHTGGRDLTESKT